MESPTIDSTDEESVTNSIPISKFKSNHLSKKERFVDAEADVPDVQLSPTAASAMRDIQFKNIDHPSMLS